MENKITLTLDHLNENPLFQMSLSSKELFHSNLLAWFMEKKPDFAFSFIDNLEIIDKNECDKILSIEREKHSVDILLSIQLKDSSKLLVVIENKVKSLPYKEQLVKYNEKIEKEKDYKEHKKSYVLLSLIEPDFDGSLEGWKYLSYEEILNSLDALNVENIESEFIALKDIKKAYCSFIEDLIEIKDYIKGIETYNFYEKDNKIFNKIGDMRINDLVLKGIHQIIATKVRKKLENENLGLKLKAQEKDLKVVGNCYVGVDFTRSTGITDLKIVMHEHKDTRFLMGVQLQGKQLRYVLKVTPRENGNIEKNRTIAEELAKEGIWLTEGETYTRNDNLSFEKGKDKMDKKGFGKGRNNCPFCKYNKGDFLYRYDYLDGNNEIETIVDNIVFVVKYIMDNKEAIRGVIEQY